jgi:Ca2+-binding RTX toxin-like protein
MFNTINGTAGADVLTGTVGDDFITGGAGNDTIDGGGGTDNVDYEFSPGGVNVNLSTGVAQDGYGNTDTLRNIEQVGGSNNDDVIVGDGGDNYLAGRLGNDSIVGGDGNDVLVGASGFDTLVGGAGNDDLMPGAGAGGDGREVLQGGDGFDAADYSDLDTGIAADLYSGTYKDTYDSIENLIGSNFNDFLHGNYQDNVLIGGGGDDLLEGREGTDRIDGGAGTDTAVFTGVASDYTINAEGAGWVVTDHVANRDGVDHLVNVEILKFSDGSMAPSGGPAPGGGGGGGGGGTVDATIATAISHVLRLDGAHASLGVDLTNRLNAGQITMQDAVNTVLSNAHQSTAVATLSYEFFTGKIPSEGGIDFLVSPTGPNTNNINSAYYQFFSMENRYMNFAVNLGKVGEGRANFESHFGGLSLFEATRSAYQTIFGEAPSDTKLHALLDPVSNLGGVNYTRAEYFAYYGGDGPNGIGTKAAMVGWLLSEAVKADVGLYAHADDRFLADLADANGATFAVDIVGAYSNAGDVFHPG